MSVNRTYCADWREALDNAEYWDHACDLEPTGLRDGEGWLLRHFDNPHNLCVTELGHVEVIECE